MTTTFKEENGKFVMYFSGRLDTAASAQTEKDVQVLFNCEGHDIILECTELEYIFAPPSLKKLENLFIIKWNFSYINIYIVMLFY